MKHRIRVELLMDGDLTIGDRYKSHHVARVEREDGMIVYTSQETPSAEECWEDAARWCKRNKIEVVQ